MQRLASIELQLCLQYLSACEIIRVGACSHSLRHIAATPLAWQFAAPWYSHVGCDAAESPSSSSAHDGNSEKAISIPQLTSGTPSYSIRVPDPSGENFITSEELYRSSRLCNSAYLKSRTGDAAVTHLDSNHRPLFVPHPPLFTSLTPLTSAACESIDDHCPLIIEAGTLFTSAGFSGDDTPRAVFSTVIGRRPHTPPDFIRLNPFTGYVGDEAMCKAGVMWLYYPVKRGIIVDFNELVAIWKHSAQNELRIDQKEHPVLLIDSVLNPFVNRMRMIRYFFEHLEPPALTIVTNAECALFVNGRTTGLVVHADHELTTITPIIRGRILRPHIKHINIGSRNVLAYLVHLISHLSPKWTFHSASERMAVQDIMERHTFVGKERPEESEMIVPPLPEQQDPHRYYPPQQAHQQSAQPPHSPSDIIYEFPDRSEIRLTIREQTQCQEVWFHYPLTSQLNLRVGEARFSAAKVTFVSTGRATLEEQHEPNPPLELNLPDAILACITSCPDECQEELWSNIVLAGSSMKVKGMDERLVSELCMIVPEKHRDHVKILSKEPAGTRAYSSWIGGSLLTTMPAFHSSWLTREEFDHYGEEVIHHKCGL